MPTTPSIGKRKQYNGPKIMRMIFNRRSVLEPEPGPRRRRKPKPKNGPRFKSGGRRRRKQMRPKP